MRERNEITWEKHVYLFRKSITDEYKNEIFHSSDFNFFLKAINKIRNNILTPPISSTKNNGKISQIKKCELGLLSLSSEDIAAIIISRLVKGCFDAFIKKGHYRLSDASIAIGKSCKKLFVEKSKNETFKSNIINHLINRQRGKNKSKIESNAKKLFKRLENNWEDEDLDIHLGGMLCYLAPVYLKKYFQLDKELIKEDKPAVRVICFTPKWKNKLEHRFNEKKIIHAKYLPTIISPKKWQSYIGGGYYSKSLSFVKEKGKKINREELETHKMPQVFKAINTLQNTAWGINQDIYNKIIEALGKHRGNGINGIPLERNNVLEKKIKVKKNKYFHFKRINDKKYIDCFNNTINKITVCSCSLSTDGFRNQVNETNKKIIKIQNDKRIDNSCKI